MSALAWRIARRELRGGIRGFRVFLLCLILGTGAIAALGTVRNAIEQALDAQGSVLLGGDAQLEFTYRFPTAEERDWVEARADRVSEIVDFRSMAVVGAGAEAERALTQVKGVDDAYPLIGTLELDPPMPVAAALGVENGLPGAVMEGVLADRLGLTPGDTFQLGRNSFTYRARIVREPDSATGGFSLGPRLILHRNALEGAGLLEAGSIFETNLRLTLPEGADLAALKREAVAHFEGVGMRWSDRSRAAPGVERFVERMGSFLVLVGLAGLAVGGVGISAATRAWMERKTETIATLKALGATSGLIRQVFLLQLAGLVALGLVIGLTLGALLPKLAEGIIAAQMPFAVTVGFAPGALAEAALYGALVAALFTLWPLGRMAEVRAAALFRDIGPGRRGWPGRGTALAIAVLALVLVGVAVGLSGVPTLALATMAGIAASLAGLALVAAGVRRLARRLAFGMKGRPMLRAALSAIGGPQSEAGAVILSLGLGLSVLAAVGQIDAGLRNAIATELPQVAPAYFVVDIQPDQIDPIKAMLAANPAVTRVDSAPMLRGVITEINGRPAREVGGDHWVVRGDRGISYADALPSGTKITAGTWWPEGYTGPAQVSMAAKEAEELGLKLGDTMVVNVLGRDIPATITSFREVNFGTAGIGFVLVLNASALQGAPHTHIATIYAPPEAEAGILRDIAGPYPNITAIGVRETIGQVSEAMGAIARATAIAAAATLVTGFIVLIGAAAAGERQRAWEAAILKVLGATRGAILWSFALRAGLMGAAAGLVALAIGTAACWAVLVYVMETPFHFAPIPALGIVLGGILATTLAGMLFALRPLNAPPMGQLRARD